MVLARSRVCLASLLGVAFLGPAVAGERPRWPVQNPLIAERGFVPTFKSRVLSGGFGARLKWGANRYDHHEGWDFYAFYDKAAYPGGHHGVEAVFAGRVAELIDPANPEGTETGRKVLLEHAVAWSSFGAPRSWGRVLTGYLHLERLDVALGEVVEAGQALGTAGATGHTRTVHLHFNAYRRDGKRLVNVNPVRLFTGKAAGWLRRLTKRTAQLRWLGRDAGDGRAWLRLLVAHDCESFDGLRLTVDKSPTLGFSFEGVSARLRDRRDRGDQDLFEGLRLFPLRYNGGESVVRLNSKERLPSSWPARRFAVKADGAWRGWDIELTELSAQARRIKVKLLGVLGESLKMELKVPK